MKAEEDSIESIRSSPSSVGGHVPRNVQGMNRESSHRFRKTSNVDAADVPKDYIEHRRVRAEVAAAHHRCRRAGDVAGKSQGSGQTSEISRATRTRPSWRDRSKRGWRKFRQRCRKTWATIPTKPPRHTPCYSLPRSMMGLGKKRWVYEYERAIAGQDAIIVDRQATGQPEIVAHR